MGPVTVLVLALALPAAPVDQAASAAQPDRAAVIKTAEGIMQRARYCTLVTIGDLRDFSLNQGMKHGLRASSILRSTSVHFP